MIDLAPLSRHAKIALSFSGGKDSLACVYLLRPYLDRITVYHLDTGDLLPETLESVRHVEGFAPRFVRVASDVSGWIARHGLPTDLLPHSAHEIGREMGENAVRLVSRYDCCAANLMVPVYRRMKDDGNTLIIRGSKAADMARLPVRSGETHDGLEFWLPLEGWSHEAVFDYLRSVGAPISRIYQHVTNSPECARCSAWWSEKRAAYLREFHPAIWADYRTRLHQVFEGIRAPLENLTRELEGVA